MIIQEKRIGTSLISPDLSPKILQTVICEREDSHKGTYRTNIGSEHYSCTEEKH